MTGDATAVRQVEVAIIGAGFAGLGMAIRLRRRGMGDFVILERADAVGGTWRDNSYPGVACDVPSHLYSYSFRPHAGWSRLFAPGQEIRGYLEEAVRDEGLATHLRLGADVEDVTWDPARGRWSLRTTGGDWSAAVVVLAAGRLSEPRVPRIPGLGDFPGTVVHTARWSDAIDWRGRRVAVVGSGASAIQIVPELAPDAAQLVVMQRSAPYIVPRGDRAYTDAELALFERDPDELGRVREGLFWKAEEGLAQRTGSPEITAAARARALDHLARSVADPALRAALTPDYEIGCKRVLLSDDYYPALQRPNVDLVVSGLAAVEGSTLVARDGSRREADVIVLATGFHSAEQPYARRVNGVGGVSLAEHWTGGMTSYASTVVHGFPNLFVLDGPNGALGHNSAIYMIETQIDYVLGALRHRAVDPVPSQVSLEAEQAYTAEIERLSAGSVWMTGGCESWYRDPRSGRLTLLWPDFAFAFRRRNGEFSPDVFEPVPSGADLDLG